MDLDNTKMKGIEERLDLVVHLLTAMLTKDMTKKESVLTLSRAGLAPKQIAGMLGLTGNQVSVVLYGAKQAAAKEPKSVTPTSAEA